ncbi:hypothetical protein B0H10DRAFT_2208130 [Mycena sp. CBHHK59/15]|nr:hypothetical protein B0H10DRAFT_2208130 [Mycena sp. CBHHK59/15]
MSGFPLIISRDVPCPPERRLPSLHQHRAEIWALLPISVSTPAAAATSSSPPAQYVGGPSSGRGVAYLVGDACSSITLSTGSGQWMHTAGLWCWRSHYKEATRTPSFPAPTTMRVGARPLPCMADALRAPATRALLTRCSSPARVAESVSSSARISVVLRALSHRLDPRRARATWGVLLHADPQPPPNAV